MAEIERRLQSYTAKHKLAQSFETRRFHYMIIGIVFTDLTLLLIGLVLAIYGTREALLANFILFLFSWIFPTIFLIETALKVWVAGGPNKYFNTSIKKWDFGILIFSVVSDIALYVLLMEHASATATLVIIFRLWKIIRLFHVYAHMVQLRNSKIRAQVEANNTELERELVAVKLENLELRSNLEAQG